MYLYTPTVLKTNIENESQIKNTFPALKLVLLKALQIVWMQLNKIIDID